MTNFEQAPNPHKDAFFVALKLLLRDGDKLLITHDIFGAWDIPGGRIRKEEFGTNDITTIKRKMDEELGEAVRFSIGKPVITFRVTREEHSYDGQMVQIYAVGYEAAYEGGEVSLGKHHDKMEWVDVTTFKPEDYFTGGWLVGVQDYLNIVRGNH